MSTKFYLYVSPFNGIELYGQKGYEFFHFIRKDSYLNPPHLNLEGARIRYDFVQYGWREITPAQAKEVLRDIWCNTTYIWAYEQALKDNALEMINNAINS